MPGDALSFDQQGEYVLAVDEKNTVERKSVKTSFQVGDMVVVEGGLNADDWVITDGLLQAIPGREVRPERTTMRPPAGDAAGT